MAPSAQRSNHHYLFVGTRSDTHHHQSLGCIGLRLLRHQPSKRTRSGLNALRQVPVLTLSGYVSNCSEYLFKDRVTIVTRCYKIIIKSTT